MDNVFNAINLMNGRDTTKQKEATQWLAKWQTERQAWSDSNTILSDENGDAQTWFMGAHTLRQKILFDFFELAEDDRKQLRDVVVSHAQKYSMKDGITTSQLALSIADIALHMLGPTWPNPVEDLFQKLQNNNVSLLVDVLRFLAEENKNKKLMVEQQKRTENAQYLQTKVFMVLQFIKKIYPDAIRNVNMGKKVLECYLAWLRFLTADPFEDVEGNKQLSIDASQFNEMIDPMVFHCFECINESHLEEVPTDIIYEAISICGGRNLERFQGIALQLMQKVKGLETLLGRFLKDQLNEPNGLRNICRVFTITGESMTQILVLHCDEDVCQFIINALLQLSNAQDSETALIALEFWHRLAAAVDHTADRDKRNKFMIIFQNLIHILIERSRIPRDCHPFKMDEDTEKYRTRIQTIVGDCTRIIQPNDVMELIVQKLVSQTNKEADVLEAHLHCLYALGISDGDKIEVREQSVFWTVLSNILSLINEPIPVPAPSGPELAILKLQKYTTINILREYARWVASKPEIMSPVFDCLSKILLAPDDKLMDLSHGEIQRAAMNAFYSICLVAQNLQNYAQQMLQLYSETLKNELDIRQHLRLTESVARVIEKIVPEDLFKQNLQVMVLPLMNVFHNYKGEIMDPEKASQILDRLTCIVRCSYTSHSENPRCTPERENNMGQLIESAIWPITQQVLSQHWNHSQTVEKTCRLIKHSMRCVPSKFKPLVPQCAELINTYFTKKQFSSYLYCTEILVDTYGSDPECQQVLAKLYNALSQLGLATLTELAGNHNNIAHLSEVIEDYFGMHNRFLKHAPDIVFQCPLFSNSLEMCIRCMRVEQKEAVEAIFGLIDCLYELGVKRPNDLTHHLLSFTPHCLSKLFEIQEGVPPSYVDSFLPDTYWFIRIWAQGFAQQQFMEWLIAGLNKLPPATFDNINTLQQNLCVGDKQVVNRIFYDITYKCEQIKLRNKEILK